ncbi:MAG: hypothetical protein QM697_06775 [Lachnospiraceae bacterium]
MKRANKVIAIMLVVFLSAGILFSYDYIVEHTHHNCSGTDCSVCIQIKEAVQFISGIRFAAVQTYMAAVLCIVVLGTASAKNHIDIKNTLVTLKVEMLN